MKKLSKNFQFKDSSGKPFAPNYSNSRSQSRLLISSFKKTTPKTKFLTTDLVKFHIFTGIEKIAAKTDHEIILSLHIESFHSIQNKHFLVIDAGSLNIKDS